MNVKNIVLIMAVLFIASPLIDTVSAQWYNDSYIYRVNVSFDNYLGMNRYPEVVYYRLEHNRTNNNDCRGITVSNSTDNGTLIYNTTRVNGSVCDVFFKVNISASYNGTVAFIYFDNQTPGGGTPVALGNIPLLNETFDDNNPFDNSTGYNWTVNAGGMDVQKGILNVTGNGNMYVGSVGNFPKFWNNVTIVANQSGTGTGIFMNAWMGNSSAMTDVGYCLKVDDYDGGLRFIGKGDNSIYYNGTDVTTLTWSHTATTYYHWRMTKGDQDNKGIRFYIDDINYNTIDTPDAKWGTIGFEASAVQSKVDYVEVVPNIYYRNLWATIKSTIQINSGYNQAPTITITNPANLTYINSQVWLNFSFVDRENTTAACVKKVDSVNTALGSIANNTVNRTMLFNLSNGWHNVTVLCWDGTTNASTTVSFTTLHYNITDERWDENQTETNRTYFVLNISSSSNVASIVARLYHNNTEYNSTRTINGLLYGFNTSVLIPIVAANNTHFFFNWTINITYNNGSSSFYKTTQRYDNATFAFNMLELTGNNTLMLEGTLFNISANATVSMPRVNTERTVVFFMNLSYNGTSLEMPLVSNTTTIYNFFKSLTGVLLPNTVGNLSMSFNASFIVSLNGNSRTMQKYQYIVWFEKINVSSCTSGTYALNFSFFDEQYPLNPVGNDSLAIDITAWYENTSFFGNYSFNFSSLTATSFSICISPTYSKINANATIVYSSNGYWQRTYYLVNALLSSSTTLINLYVLNNSIDGLTKIYVESSVGEPQEGLFVQMQRYYPETASTGAYKTIGIVKTISITGDALTYLQHHDAFYRFIILRDNTILKTSSNQQITKESSLDLFATVPLRISDALLDYYYYLRGTLIAFTCSVNNNTAVVTCGVVDTSGLMAKANLSVYKNISLSTVTACSVMAISSGSTLTCNVSGSGAGVYRYILSIDVASGRHYVLKSSEFAYGQEPNMGDMGLIIYIFFITIFTFIGIWNYYAGLGMLAFGTILGFTVLGLGWMSFSSLVSIILLIFIFITREK